MGISSRPVGHVDLNRSDLLLFQRLCDFGFLSTHQIADHVLCGSRQAAANRLLKLRRAGYVAFAPRCTTERASIYKPVIHSLKPILSERVIERGRKSTSAPVWTRSHLVHEQASQDLALRMLRLCPQFEIDMDYMLFTRDWEGDFRESSSTSKVPDFVVKVNRKRVAIFEIELHQKSKSRYFRIFSRLIRNAKCSIVYVCGDQTIADSVTKNFDLVARHLASTRNVRVPKLLTILMDEILNDDGLRRLLSELNVEPRCQRY